ncbi:MAG: hypothetical protein ACREBB_10850 [Nitrosotalea sp.]
MQVHSDRFTASGIRTKRSKGYAWMAVAILLGAALTFIFIVAPHMTSYAAPCKIVVGHFCPHNTSYSSGIAFAGFGLMIGSLLVAIPLIWKSRM